MSVFSRNFDSSRHGRQGVLRCYTQQRYVVARLVNLLTDTSQVSTFQQDGKYHRRDLKTSLSIIRRGLIRKIFMAPIHERIRCYAEDFLNLNVFYERNHRHCYQSCVFSRFIRKVEMFGHISGSNHAPWCPLPTAQLHQNPRRNAIKWNKKNV